MSPDQGQNEYGTLLWRIGQITDRPVLGANGTFVDGKDVEVIFWDGSIEHVSYPRSIYNPETIRQAAQQAAERHLAVKNLQGPLIPPEIVGS